MRNFQKYRVLFVDIDSTIIYGFWTQVMHYSWEWFHNDVLSDILMRLQTTFKLYKINKKLQFILQHFGGPIVFITVRKPNKATPVLLSQVLGFNVDVYALATDNAAEEKLNTALTYMEEHNIPLDMACMIDDNFEVRALFDWYGLDVVNPLGMFDEVVA